MLVLLVACSDQGLTGDQAPFQDDPLDTSPFVPPVDSADTALPTEECNGVDDDGDGLVDEGYPDDDENGRADCMDVTCPELDVPGAGEVTRTETCPASGAAVVDPWHMKLLWQANAPTTDPNQTASVTAPIVAQLDDDDGDGDVDADDTPDVLVTVFSPNDMTTGTLVAVDGATGTTKWQLDGIDPLGGLAAADLDGDGAAEVVHFNGYDDLAVADSDGTVLWRTSVGARALSEPLVTLLDWDGDGAPDLYTNGAFYAAADGSLLDDLGFVSQYSLPAFADLDGDGALDVVTAQAALAHDGTVLWYTSNTTPDAWPLLVQADADDAPEIVLAGQFFTLYDTDGSFLSDAPGSSGAIPTAPAVGDFDGDGVSEVAQVVTNVLTLYELDGTVDWSTGVHDFSTYAGCAGADLDGDGALEIVYADEGSFGVYDGRTGAVDLSDSSHTSVTIAEYPVPADVDGDGHLDVLVVSGGTTGWGALTAVTMDGVGWAGGRGEWPLHDPDGERVEDGVVATGPITPWLDDGVIRATPTTFGYGVDLGVAFTDECAADCDYGPVAVAVQVWNAGSADAPAGGTLTVYTDDRVVANEVLPEVPAGTSLDAVELDLLPTDIPTVAWRAEVTAPDGTTECNPDDDVAYDYEGVCP